MKPGDAPEGVEKDGRAKLDKREGEGKSRQTDDESHLQYCTGQTDDCDQ